MGVEVLESLKKGGVQIRGIGKIGGAVLKEGAITYFLAN